jgi:hypothetical protein
VPIDLKSFQLDDQTIPMPAKGNGRAKGKRPNALNSKYIPAIPLAWCLGAVAAVKSNGQVLFALLLYRRWVIGHKREVTITNALYGGDNHGGSRRLRGAALAGLAKAGLVEVTRPARRGRAARVQLLFPKSEVPQWVCDRDDD